MPRVLLVEDNEMNRDMLERRLRRRGFEVLVAPDGETGIALAREMLPDIILMDLGLPLMDGWEATRRIRATAETRGIPVIALSSHAMLTDRERALEAGCDDFDTKPVELPRLLDKIAAALGRRAEPAP